MRVMRRQTVWLLTYWLFLVVVTVIVSAFVFFRPKSDWPHLRVGMTKAEVHQALGSPTIHQGHHSSTLRQPNLGGSIGLFRLLRNRFGRLQ